MEDTVEAVLKFWFGPEPGENRKVWFEKNAEFDAEIHRRFGALYECARAGGCDAMATDARGALALVIVLDQFPRNMFRDDPRAFATDAAALNWAKQALDRGDEALLIPVERIFLYLPFEHAEDLTEQEKSLKLFATLDPVNFEYALRHRQIIERFGRFPHRNAVLGRPSTAAELDFLKGPDSSF